MKCPNCGSENPEGTKFCGECGTSMPQGKECPACHTMNLMNMKFCQSCGFNFESDKGGSVIGDKNVIAGDVNATVNHNESTTVNHSEVYNTTNNTTNNNTTNINIKDDTKEACNCALCGKHTLKVDGYTCTNCGRFVCANDFNPDYKVCKFCSGEHVTSKGKISSFKVFKDKYTEIETANVSNRNTLTSMVTLDSTSSKLSQLIENFDLTYEASDLKDFIRFAKTKMNPDPIKMSTNPLGWQAIREAFKQKFEDIEYKLDTIECSESDKAEIKSLIKRTGKKLNKMYVLSAICCIVIIILAALIIYFNKKNGLI